MLALLNAGGFSTRRSDASVRWPRLIRSGQRTMAMDSGVFVRLAIPSYLFVGDGKLASAAQRRIELAIRKEIER